MSSARRSRRGKQSDTNIPANTNSSDKFTTRFSLKEVFNSETTTFQESSKVKFVVKPLARVWLCDGILYVIFYVNIITLLLYYYRTKTKKIRSLQIKKF